MSDDITGLCRAHSFEAATDLCRRCGLEFCEICVVYPFGPKKPYCKECAMALGGVRSNVTRHALSPRLIRRRVKQFNTFMRGRETSHEAVETPTLIDPSLDDALAAPPPAVTAAVPAGADPSSAAEQGAVPTPPPPPVPSQPGGAGPAEGVAPPIDWNKPFD